MARWVEYFIADRTAKAARRDGSSGGNESPEGGMMSSIATLAVALSLTVMILTLAVIFGFKSEVHSRLTTLSGDIIVATNRGVNPNLVRPISTSREVESVISDAVTQHGSTLRYINPYAARSVVVRGSEGVEGAVLKGVDSSFSTDLFERGLIEGEVPLFGGEAKSRNTIISKELASDMALSVGDKLELLATNEDGAIRRDLYRVGAIYSAGTGAAEKMVIFTDLRNLQRLNRWGESEVSGYEIGISNRENSIAIVEQINRELIYSSSEDLTNYNYAAFATEQLFPGIFDWLDALDINAIVVISIMMIVAIFNIITAILILVLERMQMVGILKTMGMSNASLSRLFLHRALAITLRGVVWGNGVGLTIALLQDRFQLIKLDETGYILSSVPIELGVGWLTMLNIGVVATIVLAVSLPTRIVSAIEPYKAIKFQ